MLQRQISPIKWRNSELSRTVVTGLIMKLGIVEKKQNKRVTSGTLKNGQVILPQLPMPAKPFNYISLSTTPNLEIAR
jgi:hypothetical protein